ncbi:ABC-2 family transporter protein [Desulfotomaculum arcticum]|uniref:ABC-2 family transporter protein n=1 Tax=Desulfotruncus arcticus DSM 17038 TaxID=1121424 RepID=A0A1I2NAY1_9FIRM|nr:ABC transporter permease subunit [Desulfotruncus arcticus]SFF98887.1 ABC-2 family transporter protein [Desulfotomaculum arcticum] [Desulfotruncus arcticus DSM 17038]
MLTILKFTFKEHFSRKLLIFSLILAGIFLGLYGLGVHYTAKDLAQNQNPMIVDIVFPQILSLGLYFGGFIVSFLAIFSTVGTVSSEIENGIIQTIIIKPVRRCDIILGKFLGTGVFLALYAFLFFLALYFIIRLETGLELTGLWKAAALFALQPIILLAVTLLGSTIISTIANGVVAFTVYMIGIIGGMVEQIAWLINNVTLQKAGIIASLIMPVDALYRKIVNSLLNPTGNPMTALQQLGPFGSMVEPSVWMVVYAIFYVLLLVGLAVYSFNKRNI